MYTYIHIHVYVICVYIYIYVCKCLVCARHKEQVRTPVELPLPQFRLTGEHITTLNASGSHLLARKASRLGKAIGLRNCHAPCTMLHALHESIQHSAYVMSYIYTHIYTYIHILRQLPLASYDTITIANGQRYHSQLPTLLRQHLFGQVGGRLCHRQLQLVEVGRWSRVCTPTS